MSAPRKFTPADIAYIRQCRKVREATPSTRALARRYGVCQATIQKAERGDSYKDVGRG